jgi:hypothetical protein
MSKKGLKASKNADKFHLSALLPKGFIFGSTEREKTFHPILQLLN